MSATETADAIDSAAQDWFLRLSSGQTAEADLRAFAAWRDADPRHAAAYAELCQLWDDVEPLRPAFSPTGSAVPPLSRRVPFRRPAMAGGLVAAGLALFLVVALSVPSGLFADHRSGLGRQSAVTLPDGSLAHLNTDTAIDVAFTETGRQVRLLHGEAWFQVRKDAARPFAVEAEGGRTTAIGTAFAVRDAGDSVLVTVTEGTVQVASPVDDATEHTVMAQAGHQVRYDRGQSPGPARISDPAAETAWRNGQLVIRNRPLADALAEIERYRVGKILLLGEPPTRHAVTARLALDDLDGGIDMLAATHGLSTTRLTPYLVVIR